MTNHFVHCLADMLHAGQAMLTLIEWTLIEHEMQM